MENKGIIINVLAVLVVLGIVFFSQSASWRPQNGADTHAETRGSGFIAPITDWLKTHVYPKTSVEVEKRGGELQQAALEQKDVAVKNIWEKIKNYFAEKFSKFSGTEVE